MQLILHLKTAHCAENRYLYAENRYLCFKHSAVVTDCFQVRLVVLVKTTSFLPPCKQTAAFFMSHCSHSALLTSFRHWCSFSRGSQLVAHLSGCICWMFHSQIALYALLELVEAQFDKLHAGLKHLSVFQISN